MELIPTAGYSHVCQVESGVCRNSFAAAERKVRLIVIDNVMSLFFARNKKLFKMVFWNEYQGKLSNGIAVGTPIQEAVNEDSSLEYDDWNEIYQSANGYWLEDDLDTKKVMSISVFIRELLNDDIFDYCEW